MKVGDRVRWTSQSQGYRREKRGEVVAVVPPGVHPCVAWNRFEAGEFRISPLFSSASYSLPRNHESYLIAVPTKTGRGKARLYWPVVSLLQDNVEPVP